ncbi:hypothetical protein PLICRDRAFT_118594 [Plicaturopsis crispa FD-325 SS-3]|uniref:Glutathione S-transferase n=1 Tax=Plicaturopsis crispa FD-325 SS-3 TaxID=944288 RepID=A0A0C9T3N3_PLICR|nr:hypothetical protein PLICRDRAFT_118594 [Plicaturopsis crispa FD-325 SS-3]
MSTHPKYTIIGTPFSTFTRTVTLGMHHKNLPFEQTRALFHTDAARTGHPFGFLPSLIVHRDGARDVALCETQAIVRYLDRIAPEPSLQIADGDGGAPLAEKMWEFVSLTASFGFPAVEVGVVKKRVAATDEGVLSDAEIRGQIQDGVAELKNFLAVAESLMAPEGYVFGEKLSWADFYLFPLLADLQAIPEGEVLSERMRGWLARMEGLEAVKATTPGTLSAGARPP